MKPAFLENIDDSAVERINASYKSRNEWEQDDVGYILIKIFPESKELGARFVTTDHKAKYDIIGKDAESIVQTLVRMKLIGNLQHSAYLGHELHKAEVALKLGKNFIQDSPLRF
ncbi:DUF4346 domain-containing protein [Candidatus Woesearchaeota archaeon]|nr:DUF4346 domain-containing protein [Candidatus Woesearchaeota archaeon]